LAAALFFSSQNKKKTLAATLLFTGETCHNEDTVACRFFFLPMMAEGVLHNGRLYKL